MKYLLIYYIVLKEWDLRNELQIAECVRHSDIVYNLVGRNYETKYSVLTYCSTVYYLTAFFRRNFDFHAVHAKGAESIARIAAENGVPRLVHVSHLNASPNSTSQFYKTKYEGEQLVKEAFPTATIVRPAAMYGFEDKLLNNIASMFSRLRKKCSPLILFL